MLERRDASAATNAIAGASSVLEHGAAEVAGHCLHVVPIAEVFGDDPFLTAAEACEVGIGDVGVFQPPVVVMHRPRHVFVLLAAP